MRRSITQDISFSFRTLIKHPGFTITAVLTLALGIGATTAIFSVVYAVFEPMPYPKPEQLVMVWSKIHGERNSVAPGDYLMAFGVAQRRHEFGVRMALGAQRSRVIRLVLKEGTIVAVV